MGRILLATAAAGILLAAFATGAGGAGTELVGTVGPGFSISLVDAGGAPVTRLDPGTYTLLVHDRSDVHNFHLACGGDPNVATEVAFVGDRTFTIALRDGTSCEYVCDPHLTAMRGSFTVGDAAPPASTPPKRTAKTLSARLAVGPGKALRAPARLRAGRYALTLDDRSRRDNLHLRGPGLDRKTGVAFVGVRRVQVTLRRGVYTVSSDATKTLVRRIVVR